MQGTNLRNHHVGSNGEEKKIYVMVSKICLMKNIKIEITDGKSLDNNLISEDVQT